MLMPIPIDGLCGLLLLFVLNFQDEAELLGDRVVVIAKGSVQATGTAMELKQQYGQ